MKGIKDTFEVRIMIRLSYLLSIGFVFCNSLLQAQTVGGIDLKDPIKLDRSVKADTLINGFTYYIRKNNNPENGVVMYFVVRAGFYQQDSDQIELPHLLEHLAFRRTVHFDHPSEVFDRLGLKKGSDVNGNTTDDETSYRLSIPVADSKSIGEALMYFRDVAHGISLTEEDVDVERGVVVDEISRGRGYYQRMMEHYYPLVLNGCGKVMKAESRMESIRSAKLEPLIRFYEDWYTPDLQALIVVGDVDVALVEAQIRALFSDLKRPVQSRERRRCIPPNNQGARFVLSTDREMPFTEIEMGMKRAVRRNGTYLDVKDYMIEDIYGRIMRSRFQYYNNTSGYGFQFGSHRIVNNLLSGTHVYQTRIQMRPGAFEEGFRSVLKELERARRHGFLQSEFAKAKSEVLSTYVTGKQTESEDLAFKYKLHYVSKGESPIISDEEILKSLSNTIVLDDINALARDGINFDNVDIVVLAPEKDRELIPVKDTLMAWISDVRKSEMSGYKSAFELSDSLILSTKRGGFIPGKATVINIEDVGITKLELASGISVLFKPVKGKGSDVGTIRLRAFRKGGASIYTNSDYYCAAFAAEIVDNTGIGPFAKSQLKAFGGKTGMEIHPYIYHFQEGVRGTSKIKDLPAMLQLMTLLFANPVKNEDAFLEWRGRQENAVAFGKSDDHKILQDTVQSMIGDFGIYRRDYTLTDLRNVSLDRAMAIYGDKFKSASNFTFILTGDFDTDSIKSLVLEHLSLLPVDERPVTSLNYSVQREIGTKLIYSGVEDNAGVHLRSMGRFSGKYRRILQLQILGDLVENQLTSRLRGQEGGTYGVLSQFVYSDFGQKYYSIQVEFDCAVKDVKRLTLAALQEVDNIGRNGPDEGIARKLIQNRVREVERSLDNAVFWENYLTRQLLGGRNINEVLSSVSILRELTARNLSQAARHYLNTKKMLKVILLPQALIYKEDLSSL